MTSPSRTPLTGGTSSEGRVSGYVLKLLRESLPRTQQELAADLGVQVVTVQGWESGRRPIMRMAAHDLITVQQRLRRLGAAPALLDALGLAVEADVFIGQALGDAPEKSDPAQHLLGSWVITRLFTGLIGWPLSGQAPAELPYGQRRLLAILRAVATRPSILLLDEPAAGLSDIDRHELRSLVRRLAEELGLGVLLIEHDVELVMSVSDRVIAMDFGRVIAAGTPADVRRNPEVIRSYLGTDDEDTPEEIPDLVPGLSTAETML